MKKLLIGLLTLGFVSAFASVQRFEILGSSKTGSRLAIVTTHFSPAASAPIASVRIIDAVHNNVIYEKSVMDLFGDEDRLQELKKQIISETKSTLSELGISDTKFYPMINISSKFNNQILVESDATIGTAPFYTNIYFFNELNTECENKLSFSYVISPLAPGLEPISNKKTGLSCYIQTIDVSNLIQVNEYIWYFIFETMEFMPGVIFKNLQVYGINKPDKSD
ncbi:MAG: hypothetical protein ACOYL6_18175 [Bacteriovoracaceae bacterium]